MIAIRAIIAAIETNSDMTTMASSIGLSDDAFKQAVINAMARSYPKGIIKPTEADNIIEDDGYSSDDSNTEDMFDQILKQSKIKFSDEQIAFMQLAVKSRKNLALLAPAGYGKSETLITTIKLFKACVKQDTIQHFANLYGINQEDAQILSEKPVVYLCASTGKAASLLHVRTIYSLLGIGIGRGTPAQWYKRVSTAKYLKGSFQLLRSIKCLIIDEISMIGGTILDKISEYFKLIKQRAEPFGNIQIILVGDFAQLPPINDVFAFQCASYNHANITLMTLSKCFRQSDPVFKNILDELRFGFLSPESFAVLRNQTSIDAEYAGDIKPTLLCSTNAEVDIINNREIQRVCEETKQTPQKFKIMNMKTADYKKADACRKADGLTESVDLVIGAQVMVTFNISHDLINGTQGVVTEMNNNYVTIKQPNGESNDIPYIGFKDPDAEDVYTAKDLFQYMPLRVSYAMSIHKSQGTTLQLLEIDCKRIFVAGQLYVGISRVRDLRGLIVKNLNNKAVMCHPLVKQFYQ